MTLINVQPLQVRIGGLVAADATVQLQCWAGDGPAVRSSGPGVIFPPVETVRLTAGVPAAPIDYPATLGTCCVKITVRSAAGFFALERYVAIPETGPVDFDDLVDVDPSTFAPSLENITAWQAWRDAAQLLVSTAVQAAADAGTFAAATEFDAGRAGDSAFEAGKSAAIALGHKNAAKLSEDAAATSAGAASTSEGNSKTSETNAASSAAAAQAATFAGTTPAANTSLDSLTTPGMYRITWGATVAQGAPFESFYGSLRVEIRAGGAVTQVARKHNALSADSGQFWQRTQTGAGWGAWFTYSSSRVSTVGEVFLRTGLTTEAQLEVDNIPLGTTSLDSISAAGKYYNANFTDATLARGYPVADVIGHLEVLREGSFITIQRYTIRTASNGSVFAGAARGVYQRRFSGGAWGPWWFIAGQRVDKTVGIAVYTWDDANNREQRVYGDTGWRDISALRNTNWAGTFLLRRQGDRVTILLNNVTRQTGETTQKLLGSLPVGYQGTEIFGPQRFMVHVPSSPVTAYRGYFTDSGTSMFFDAPIGAGLYGSFDYITSDPWPSAPIGSFLTAPSVQ